MPNESRPRGRGWRRAQQAKKKDAARAWFSHWKLVKVTPRMVGMKATTPRDCSCSLCKRERGLRIGELRRTLTVDEAVADIFDDRYTEAEAAFHEAMLFDSLALSEDYDAEQWQRFITDDYYHEYEPTEDYRFRDAEMAA